MAIDDVCVSFKNDPIIVLKDNGMSARFLNHERKGFVEVRIDGCVVKDGKRADFVLRQEEVGDLIVELKGCDVERALQQIEETAEFWKIKENNKKIAGLIVCACVPKVPGKIQTAKQRFAKKYNSHLTIECKGKDYIFARLFRF